MTTTKTLADLGVDHLYDAPTGQLIPDDPAAYTVLEHDRDGESEYLLCVGPSGQVDCLVRDITGDSLYRDTGCETVAEFKASR